MLQHCIGRIQCNFPFKTQFCVLTKNCTLCFELDPVLNYIPCFEATVVCPVVALNQRDGDTLLNRNGVISHASPATVFIQIQIQIQIHTNTNTYKTSFNVDSLVISYRVVF